MNIACLSDTHCITKEVEGCSILPRQLDVIPRKKLKRLYIEIEKEIKRAFDTSIVWLEQNGPWDLLIHLGDITGGYLEEGCYHPSVQKVAKKTYQDLQSLTPKILWCLGNHDTGYSYPGSLPGSGIHLASILACQKIFGDLFWVYEKKGVLFIGLCSPIAYYNGLDPAILRFKKEQETFLGDTLSGFRGPWMLFAHHPLTPKNFVRQIEGHTKRLLGMVCGDIHEPWRRNLLKRIARIPGLILLASHQKRTVLECLKKYIPCPSTAPLWWRGYGLLTLSLDGRKKVNPREIILDRPPDSKDLPTSSVWRYFWWMLRSKIIK